MTSRWIFGIPPRGFLALAALLIACGSDETGPNGSGKNASIVAFAAAPSTLEAPGAVELSWKTANAVSLALTLDGEAVDLGDAPVAEGSVEVRVEATGTFELVASGSTGTPARRSFQVTVGGSGDAPTIETFVGPEAVGMNEAGKALASLSWTGIAGADVVMLEGGLEPIQVAASEIPDGGVEVEIIADTTFSLVARNAWGEASREVEVRLVDLPVIGALTTDRSWAGLGDSVLVEWETTGAVEVELYVNDEPVELVDFTVTTGSTEVAVHFDSTIELRALNELGQVASAQVEVKVAAPAVVRFEGSATGLWTGETLELSWETQGGNNLQIAVEGTNEVVCAAASLEEVAQSSCSWQPEPGAYVLSLTVENGSGIVSRSLTLEVGDGPQITVFTVSPEELTVGDSLTVTWTALPDPLGQPPALSLRDDRGGTYELSGLQGETSFAFDRGTGSFELTLTASTDHPNSNPAEAKATFVVHPPPTVTLTATPTIFDDGETEDVVIEWTSQSATTLILTQHLSSGGSEVIEVIPEERRAAGSYRFVPEQDSTFRIDARNALGVLVFAEAAVTLAPPQMLEFTAGTNTYDIGDAVELSWKTRMATDVRISIFDQAYVAGETGAPFVDAAKEGGTHLPMSEACNLTVLHEGCADLSFPAGFRFPYSGGSFDSVRVFGNGFLSFDASGSGTSSQNQAFPTGTSHQHVHLAPFWDALTWDAARFPAGNVHYLLQGDAGSRSLVIQWKGATLAAMSSGRKANLNFEVVLHEDGAFDFRYGDMDAPLDATEIEIDGVDGKSATIGYQTRDRGSWHMRQHNRNVNVWGTLYGRSFSYLPTPTVSANGTYVWHPYPVAETMQITATASRGTLEDGESLTFTANRRPELRFVQRPEAPVEVGTEFRIGWNSRYASKVEIRDAGGALVCEATVPQEVTSGFCLRTEAAQGTFTYRVRALDARGGSIEKLLEVVVYEPFGIDSFSLDKEIVEEGGEVTLSWVTHDASAISLTANGVELLTGTAPAAGSQVHRVERDTTFVLRVENALGVFFEESRSIQVWNVDLALTPSATSVRPGEAVTIGVAVTPRDGEPAPRVFGTFPMQEVLPSPAYQDISAIEGASRVTVDGTTRGSAEVKFPRDFSFPYFGETFDSMTVFIDGYASFAETETHETNVPLPAPGGGPTSGIHLAPFWDDLSFWAGAEIWTAQTAPNTFVIQWTGVSAATGSGSSNPYSLNFQIALQSDGAFEYRYGTMSPPAQGSASCRPSSCVNEANGSSATIAYQAPGGTMGLTVHHGGSASGPGNPTFPGGLSNRVLRYEPFLSGTQLVVHPIRTGTYTFCIQPERHMLCRSVEVEAEFGIDSFSIDHGLITLGGSTTLRWKTHGGSTLRILEGDTEVWSTTNGAEIDEGTRVLSPTSNASYTLELTGLSNRAIATGYVDVVRLDITATATPSVTRPGTPVTLSWTARTEDSNFQPMIVAPMEEVAGFPFSARDISGLAGVETVFSGGAATGVRTVTFPEGFTFPYLGVPQSQVQVSGLGFLSFDPATNNGPTTNTTLPNAANSRVHLAPFWDGMHNRSSGRVYAARWDDDTFVVQWSNVSLSTGSTNANEYDLNFMVVLHRDGSFEYRYGTMAPSPAGHTNCRPATCVNEANGSTATIGFQDTSSTFGHVLNFSNTPADEKAVPGGLADRTWRFTPGGLTGTRQVAPWETTTYRICALDLATRDVVCANPVEVETRWGIASFDVDESNPLPNAPVRLSWDVIGLESLRLTANGVTLFDEPAGVFSEQGSLNEFPGGPVEYVLEGRSLGRTVQVARLVEPRTFTLALTPDETSILPGDEVTIQWTFTSLVAEPASYAVPLAEVSGGGSQFQDIRSVGTELVMGGSAASGCVSIFLPFNFPYLGQTRDRAAVYVDGYLSFDATCVNGIGANTALPNAGSTQSRIHIAPFWDDHLTGPNTTYWTHSPNPDTFIIQWTAMDRLLSGVAAGFDLNFQLVLSSNGAFEFRYGRMAPPAPPYTSNSCYPNTCELEAAGSSATIGYQSVDSAIAYLHHFGGNTSTTVVPLEGGVENKTFRFEPASAGSTKVRVGAQAKDFTLCGLVGAFTECKTLHLAPVVSAGELAITELMIDPTGGTSEQWFEVRNLTDRPIDLNGFVIESNSGASTIAAPAVVAPGGYALFAATTIPEAAAAWSWGTSLSLSKTVDTLSLNAGTATITSVQWGNGWTVPAGRTLSLDGSYHWAGTVSHVDAERWCPESGSPGRLGEGCRHWGYDLDPQADGTFYDISQTGTRLHDLDIGGQVVPVRVHAFDWPFFGRRYSSFWIGGNGWLSFAEEFPGGGPTVAPGLIAGSSFPRPGTAEPKGPLVGGFWDQLRCLRESNDCSVTYERGYFGGQEAVIVQWTRQQRGAATTTPSPGEITFQIQLWENGDIAVVFGDVYSPDAPGSAAWGYYHGSQAWVGIESHDVSDFVTAHLRQTVSFDNRTIRFYAK